MRLAYGSFRSRHHAGLDGAPTWLAIAVAVGAVGGGCDGDDGDTGGAVTMTDGTGSGTTVNTPDDGGDDDGDDGDGVVDDTVGAQSSGEQTSQDGDPTTDDGPVDTSAGDTATSTDDGETGDETGGQSQCGNGMIEAGETCDEANGQDADGCNEDCTASGEILWSHTQAAGLAGSEELFGVVADDDANVYVTGAFRNDKTGTDYWIRQYTEDGGLGWTVSLNGSAASNDSGRGITRVGGSVYVAGFLNNALASNDWRVGEYTLAGAAGWTSGFNGALAGSDVAESIAADVAGNVYVAGRQAVDLAGQNILIRQYTPGGAAGWTAGAGGASDDRALGVATDGEGNVVAVGFETITAQGRNVWVRKYDPTGEVVFTQTYAGVDALDDQANAVATDGAGNIVVAGHEGTILQGSVGWLRSYDPAGAVQWTQQYTGGSNEGAVFHAVAVDSMGHVVTAGTETLAGVADGLVRKYDAAGMLRWSETYATDADANQIIRGVTTGPGDGIWIAGGLDLGIDGRDTWVARLGK